MKPVLFLAFNLNNSFIINELLYYQKKNITIVVYTTSEIPIVLQKLSNVKIYRLFQSKLTKKTLALKYFLILFPIFVNELLSNVKNFGYLKTIKNEFLILLSQLDYAIQIKNIESNKKYLLYSYWFNNEAQTLSFLSLISKNKNYISRAHAFDLYEEERDYHVMPFVNFKLNHLNKLFSVSNFGYDYLKNKHPKYINKFNVSYLGTFNPSNEISKLNLNETIKVISCGSIQFRKRTDLIYKILSKIENVEWTHVGDGPQKNEFFENISLFSPIKINFTGNITNSELYSLYKSQSFDFFISLSENEGIPVSIMEAISFGIPVISTDAGGCKEIVTDRSGLLIPIDFKENELIETIKNFKSSKMNTVDFRNSVFDFWKENFDADQNYGHFVKQLTLLEDEN